MLITLKIRLEAFHKPTETWHVHEAQHGVRAVSRKHAISKGLKVLESWPGYADRQDHPEWTVGGDVTIVND